MACNAAAVVLTGDGDLLSCLSPAGRLVFIKQDILSFILGKLSGICKVISMQLLPGDTAIGIYASDTSRLLKKFLMSAVRGVGRGESGVYMRINEHFEPSNNEAMCRQGVFNSLLAGATRNTALMGRFCDCIAVKGNLFLRNQFNDDTQRRIEVFDGRLRRRRRVG